MIHLSGVRIQGEGIRGMLPRIFRAFIITVFITGYLLSDAHAMDVIPTTYANLPEWEKDGHLEALNAFRHSCRALLKKPDSEMIGNGALARPAGAWKAACVNAAKIGDSARAAQQFFEASFTPYRIRDNGKAEGLFTGYYIAEASASLTRHGNFQTPIYAPPAGLTHKDPALTRDHINAGALAGKGLEIAWADDPVAAFFIEVQGSGILNLDDGSQLAIGVAATNGHDYVAIGKVMKEQGLLEEGKVNLFTIRDWLRDHPERVREILEHNPRYVFFRRLPDAEIRGAQGVPLTPGRSLAVDPAYIPYGMPLFLEMTMPEAKAPSRHLMIAQDTGGAIRGAIRGDIYFGSGTSAERMAGMLAATGTITALVPVTPDAP